MFRRFYRNLPLVNFFISSSALAFQMNVLYPWHKQLRKDILQLKKTTLVSYK